jgi:PAS domain S-box-containing protein
MDNNWQAMFGNSIKILLVGDEGGRLESIQMLLNDTDLGRCVVDAVGPAETISRNCWRNRYDVCLIDSHDNAMDLISEARGIGFTRPIIMLTSNSADDVLQAMRAGALDCLVRDDLTAAKLEESICSVIARSRSLDNQETHERCFLALAENACEIIYSLDLKGDFTFINRAGEELTGYTKEETLGLNLSQLFTPKSVTGIWRTILRMLNDHRPASYDAVMVRKNGKHLPVTINAHLLYKDGIPIGVQSVARALAMENRFKAIDDSEHYYQGVC